MGLDCMYVDYIFNEVWTLKTIPKWMDLVAGK